MGFFKKKYEEIKTKFKEKQDLSREERKADEYSKAMAKSEARQVARETRRKGIIDVAKAKEEYKTKKEIAYIKSGGFVGKLQRLGGATAKASAPLKGKRVNIQESRGMVGDNYAYGSLGLNAPETRTTKPQGGGLSLNLSGGNSLALNLPKDKKNKRWF